MATCLSHSTDSLTRYLSSLPLSLSLSSPQSREPTVPSGHASRSLSPVLLFLSFLHFLRLVSHRGLSSAMFHPRSRSPSDSDSSLRPALPSARSTISTGGSSPAPGRWRTRNSPSQAILPSPSLHSRERQRPLWGRLPARTARAPAPVEGRTLLRFLTLILLTLGVIVRSLTEVRSASLGMIYLPYTVSRSHKISHSDRPPLREPCTTAAATSMRRRVSTSALLTTEPPTPKKCRWRRHARQIV